MAITDKVLSADVTKKGYTVPYFLLGDIGIAGENVVVSYTGYPSEELSAPENSTWSDTFTVPSGTQPELLAAVRQLQTALVKARIDELNAVE